MSIIGTHLVATLTRRRTKVTAGGVPPSRTPETRTITRQAHRLPVEILEMIIAHLIYDTPSLKACAATCIAWYNVATPHLHHTLTIWQWHSETAYRDLNPLALSYECGLLPHVKKLRFRRGFSESPWLFPDCFDSWGLHCFSALVNLQDLAIADMYFPGFVSGTEQYFGHFSPTLRSITLFRPTGSPRQLLDFLGLFPKLDDIKITHYHGVPDMLETPYVPIQGSLRGKLAFSGTAVGDVLEGIIATFGGIRFTSLHLYGVGGAQLLLDACAETLQTLYIDPGGMVHHCKRFSDPVARHMS